VADAPDNNVPAAYDRRHLARVSVFAFLLVFAAARVSVLLIMSRRIPDLYLYVGGTCVHHLNHGIFLLSGGGAYLLLGRPAGRILGPKLMEMEQGGPL
jgi:hypothetical protein